MRLVAECDAKDGEHEDRAEDHLHEERRVRGMTLAWPQREGRAENGEICQAGREAAEQLTKMSHAADLTVKASRRPSSTPKVTAGLKCATRVGNASPPHVAKTNAA
eukprot:CAMPEP_0176074680 /NCGR_PEP_ID=MMETSP0120_2-20121206/37321_1 /TAXON_ID=160619 /ORGANISM="Kryptoperidinium foliaceum, Strain CCMP 1326" /LENGTH=105 /DNA_ID=CAMNT_0017408375 /DNA_START=61 /DNA_END=379 /DNA_ORIENTATION=-